MKKIKLPLSLRMLRGAIGKRFVIKHYAHGTVQTKFPDMTKIIPSGQQLACRLSFKTAVAEAKKIFDNAAERELWEEKLQSRRRLFNRIVQYLMENAKVEQAAREIQTKRLIINCFKQKPVPLSVVIHHPATSFDSPFAFTGKVCVQTILMVQHRRYLIFT